MLQGAPEPVRARSRREDHDRADPATRIIGRADPQALWIRRACGSAGPVDHARGSERSRSTSARAWSAPTGLLKKAAWK
ncbi:hypothetical protein GCM10017559_52520 [Streptosporangium longisporum]|uniref:Uncharacterized protein n=1 Tax=Streptosporangium longisporum TaxID=46187 RepID=A0ABP6KSL2_9ACTN